MYVRFDGGKKFSFDKSVNDFPGNLYNVNSLTSSTTWVGHWAVMVFCSIIWVVRAVKSSEAVAILLIGVNACCCSPRKTRPWTLG